MLTRLPLHFRGAAIFAAFGVALSLTATSISAAIDIPLVKIGDPGNAADPTSNILLPGGAEEGDQLGAVSYEYFIGETEVTVTQYTAFLNAVAADDTHGLFNPNGHLGTIERSGTSGSYEYTVVEGFENSPLRSINFYSSVRFVNWLTNGQPTGVQDASTTESGVYELGGVTNPDITTIERNEAAFLAGGYALPTFDEWYKAAYYQPAGEGGDSDNYWLYPTSSNDVPVDGVDAWFDGHGAPLDVRSFQPNFWGVSDLGGNVTEWSESATRGNITKRARLGGRFNGPADASELAATSFLTQTPPQFSFAVMGFRVVAIPEPSTIALIVGGSGLLAFVALRRRRRD